jgi:hypothetical protein
VRWWRRFWCWLLGARPVEDVIAEAWRRYTPPIDTGEVCRTCIVLDDPDLPLQMLAADDCWEWGQELPNEPEMGTTGGSWVSGYWCTTHKPDGAWPWTP